MSLNTLLRAIFLILIFGMFFFFPGCGKKGPPVAPLSKGEKISAPYDLKYEEDKTRIELTWKHRIDETEAWVRPQGFDVFMAKLSFDECQGCPFQFKKLGDAPIKDKSFLTDIEPGFKYYFRVQAIGKGDMKSGFSETVLFEYR